MWVSRTLWYETRNRWRIVIPARFTTSKKQEFKLFVKKEDAEAEIRRDPEDLEPGKCAQAQSRGGG
jgi:hypothetical protein